MTHVDHSKNIIEVENISFSYGDTPVLKNVSFSIHHGDYLAIVGGNGSGKTTLLKTILGLTRPESGTIRLFDTDIQNFKEHSRIGYVPQKATSFDIAFPATVEEVVLMGRHADRKPLHRVTKRDEGAVQTSLERVGMEAYRDRLIGELSGGQQQRVFIARALAGEPEILFLDEPTVGVEQTIREEFYVLLKKLNDELGLTVVLVTHDLESVAHEAMHIVYLSHGSAFFHESAHDFLERHGNATHIHI